VLGVGAVILDSRRVLLVERARAPLAGQWSLPGGVVEAGERLEDALVREVFEETGLRVTTDIIATVFERIIPDAAGRCEYHYVLIDFFCAIRGGELCAGDDSCRVDWFDIDSLGTISVTDGTREVIEACYREASCSRPATYSRVTRP